MEAWTNEQDHEIGTFTGPCWRMSRIMPILVT